MWDKGKKDIKSVQNPKIKKDKSNLKCFNFGKVGHFASECWKKRKGKHDASIAKEKHAPEKKKQQEEEIQKDHFLVTSLSGSISNSDKWLIASGAFGHMTSSQNPLSRLSNKHASLQVELGDNTKYEVKGARSTSFQLD